MVRWRIFGTIENSPGALCRFYLYLYKVRSARGSLLANLLFKACNLFLSELLAGSEMPVPDAYAVSVILEPTVRNVSVQMEAIRAVALPMFATTTRITAVNFAIGDNTAARNFQANCLHRGFKLAFRGITDAAIMRMPLAAAGSGVRCPCNCAWRAKAERKRKSAAFQGLPLNQLGGSEFSSKSARNMDRGILFQISELTESASLRF